jgi:hypothetical protein
VGGADAGRKGSRFLARAKVDGSRTGFDDGEQGRLAEFDGEGAKFDGKKLVATEAEEGVDEMEGRWV